MTSARKPPAHKQKPPAAPKKPPPPAVAARAVKAAPRVAAKVAKAPPRASPPPKAPPKPPPATKPSTVTKPAAKPVPVAPPKPVVKPPPVAGASLRATPPSGSTARTPTTPDLRPGDDLPTATRGPLSRVDGARFAAASEFWSVLSLDEPGAREAGLPGAVIPGGLAFALASGLVQRWLGLSGRIGRIGARAVKLTWPGDTLIGRGRVVQVDASPEGRRIELDVWVENQKGELILRGQCHCLLPGVHLPAPAPAPAEPSPAGAVTKGGLDPRPLPNPSPTGPARPRGGR